jgi:hemolysin activation/secretion protein
VWQRSTGRDRARCALALAGALAAHAIVTLAQVPPDAGRIQEQLRVPEPPKKPAAPQIRIEPPPGEAKADTAPFFVASFRVTGATVFPEQRLAALLGEPQRPMRLSEVQALADRITELYRQHGYIVARALLPAQDVRDGIVEVRVVEGRYERIDINNASRVSERRIRGLLGAVSEDALVHGPSLERAVLLISDLAGIQATATLEPGTQPGYTNLVLEIVPARATEYDVSLDNGGSRFTGRYRLSAGATLNGPLNIGDRLSLRALVSGQNLSFVRLAYEAPVGVSGLRAIAYTSETDYHLGDQFTALGASGTARNVGAVFAYPLMRSADRNLRVQLGAEARQLDDRIDAFQVHNEKNLGLLQWGGAGDARDGFLGGGITAIQALLTHGRVDLHTPELAASDATTARTQGHFQKLFLGANRLQLVTARLRLGLNYTGQLASRNLDSSEKLSVGGITGVRAYPAGEAAGDNVHLLQAELRYNAGTWGSAQLSPLVFFDYARSRINHQVWDGFSGRNVRTLSDAGVGAEWANPGIWFIRGWYAHKLGSEEATADRDRAFRLWFQVGMLF